MSLMTREDMLRELELLPAWQLRTPAPEMAVEIGRVSTRQDVGLKPDLQVESVAEIVEIPVQILTPVAISPPTFAHIASENGEYLFVLPSAIMSAEESQLFQNICKAMRINVKAAVTSESMAEIMLANQTKLVIAMGEATAQVLLQSTESLDNLREKLHILSEIKPEPKLVATYDAGHLLVNVQDKAKAWRDLCMAMQALQE